jgi:hypothetical protein
MAEQQKLSHRSVEQAVELAKAGMPTSVGASALNFPDVVAKFIETVARKIEEITA